MNAAESRAAGEPREGTAEVGPFEEDDRAETVLPFGDGGWRWYVIALWVIVLGGIAIYAANLLVPDLAAWGAP